jgi:hypothetical protein
MDLFEILFDCLEQLCTQPLSEDFDKKLERAEARIAAGMRRGREWVLVALPWCLELLDDFVLKKSGRFMDTLHCVHQRC